MTHYTRFYPKAERLVKTSVPENRSGDRPNLLQPLPSRSMESAFKAHPRIFIVDDEFSIAQMMSVVLQMNLFDAVPYADPQEALAAARANAPDYLISDIAMRGMTGIELAAVVQQELPGCKVLLFSGQVDAPAMISAAGEQGHCFRFLQKPVHPTELVAALRNL